MSITQSDIKLMASARLSDSDDGGGMMSAVEVVDGVVNNLFPDISRLDRAYGRVNLRKAYAAIQTANKDMFYGAHAILTDAPDDPRVSVLMFSTGSYSDERDAARNRIESFLSPSIETQFVVLGNQLAGQRTILLYARPTVLPPEAGTSYVMRQEDKAGELTGPEQYVRVSSVKTEEAIFTTPAGAEFILHLHTLRITAALEFLFRGATAPSQNTNHNSLVTFRETQIADAAKYYGIVKLAESAVVGATSIKASGIYGQLVPSSTAETPLADLLAGPGKANIAQSGPRYSVTQSIVAGAVSFGRAVIPGSINLSGYLDDGKGVLRDAADVERGLVDYETGSITGITGKTGNVNYAAIPATPVFDIAMTDYDVVTTVSAGTVHVKTLRPFPLPRTLTVDYMVQGRWYRMTDVGDGEITDDHGGAGTIDYRTGTATITLGAIPDVGSSIIYSWTMENKYDGGAVVIPSEAEPSGITINIPGNKVIQPGTLTLTWMAGEQERTATDGEAGTLFGLLAGDATGRIDYGYRRIRFNPALIPDQSTMINVEYKEQLSKDETFTPLDYAASGKNVIFSVADAPIKPGSANGLFTVQYESERRFYTDDRWTLSVYKYQPVSRLQTARFYDRGNGTIVMYTSGFSLEGTINYTAGQIVLPANHETERQGASGRFTTSYAIALTGSIQVKYAGTADGSVDETFAVELPDPIISLAPTNLRQIMPGSVEFVWNSETFIDREGIVFNEWDRRTGAAKPVGSIDYSTGEVTLTDWTGGGSNAVQIKAMLTKVGDMLASELTFRTSGTPIRSGSFYIRATKEDGNMLSATGQADGLISATEILGRVSHETGTVEVKFGQMVAVSGLSSAEKQEPWYTEGEIINDEIWKPTYVDPGSIRYNSIVQSVMPLDASILGINPVRLPIDGRVPIIRPGDIVVIFSKQETELPNGLTAGQTINLPDVELAACTLVDANGDTVDEEHYTTDREAGTVTMASPLDLAAYTQPLTAQWRVEDMALVNEAQINGQLTLVGSLTHDYDPANTWVASALIFGDLASRAHHVFSQATWTNVWSDKRIGADTTAKFNDLLYPIQLNNKNSIRDRWAIIFTSATSFNVVGEQSGQIATGTTGSDCSPINPITGEPYFTIPWNGWGSGWANNNVLRFNTDAAHAPIWIARTTINGAPTKEDDSFKLQIRGDAD